MRIDCDVERERKLRQCGNGYLSVLEVTNKLLFSCPLAKATRLYIKENELSFDRNVKLSLYFNKRK